MHPERPKRRTYNEPGHAHKLTFSCYRKYPFLAAERTCLWLAESIETARTELDFDLWAHVFMPDHVHLIICPPQPAYQMATIMRAIKEPVGSRTAWFIARHAPEWLPRITQHRGHRVERYFWQPGGGYDRNIIEPTTLQAAIEYIHLNPVRRGLVVRARDWRWSSAAWFEGREGSNLIPDPIPPEWTHGGRSLPSPAYRDRGTMRLTSATRRGQNPGARSLRSLCPGHPPKLVDVRFSLHCLNKRQLVRLSGTAWQYVATPRRHAFCSKKKNGDSV